MGIKELELKDTVELMLSADFKDRFKGEYWQVKLRYGKLDYMLLAYARGELNFKPLCSLELLNHQKDVMKQYLDDLEKRAVIEGIDLNW